MCLQYGWIQKYEVKVYFSCYQQSLLSTISIFSHKKLNKNSDSLKLLFNNYLVNNFKVYLKKSGMVSGCYVDFYLHNSDIISNRGLQHSLTQSFQTDRSKAQFNSFDGSQGESNILHRKSKKFLIIIIQVKQASWCSSVFIVNAQVLVITIITVGRIFIVDEMIFCTNYFWMRSLFQQSLATPTTTQLMTCCLIGGLILASESPAMRAVLMRIDSPCMYVAQDSCSHLLNGLFTDIQGMQD